MWQENIKTGSDITKMSVDPHAIDMVPIQRPLLPTPSARDIYVHIIYPIYIIYIYMRKTNSLQMTDDVHFVVYIRPIGPVCQGKFVSLNMVNMTILFQAVLC